MCPFILNIWNLKFDVWRLIEFVKIYIKRLQIGLHVTEQTVSVEVSLMQEWEN